MELVTECQRSMITTTPAHARFLIETHARPRALKESKDKGPPDLRGSLVTERVERGVVDHGVQTEWSVRV